MRPDTAPARQAGRRPRLLFVVTEDWYFCSHRLPLAVAARAAGYDVTLAARIGEHGPRVEAAGIALAPWRIERGSTGLLAELRSLLALWRIYRQVKPDLVHQVALKPVLYGSLIARLTPGVAVVNALGGMGSLFTGGKAGGGILRRFLMHSFRGLLGARNSLLILQNEDDAGLFERQARLPRRAIRIVRGAGVSLTDFDVQPEPQGVPVVLLPARMLWDKGVGEFVAAAALLRERGIAVRCVLAGGTDPSNPAGRVGAQRPQWVADGTVEWLGMRSDMPAVLKMANIVCLPSYREGLPKALLEAAACARAIVTTDVPGCREVVREGENGLLVPARDAVALADALVRLLADPALRARMGQAGRQMAVQEFSEGGVIAATLGIYGELLPAPQALRPGVAS